ncbi:hypothetical protein PybrP1_002106 [[Pythium] brassicae (nom. inval.)]|nr:hypothetical protein PybrP1_002106 [[Pythium] brassicae (nom. inval.)]
MLRRAFSTCGERLAELGLPSGRSNAFYNQQLRAALERQDVRGAARIADALHTPLVQAQSPPKPTAVLWTPTYDALLFAWGQRGDARRALALLDEMLARGRVSSRSFNTALVACSKRRDLRAAARVLAQMRAAGKTPGAFAYANAINCCATRGGDAHAARGFWDEMLRDGVEPTIEVVNCMLRVLSRASDRSHEALRFAEDALQAFGLAPDAITVATLTQALLFDGRLGDAVGFLERVVARADRGIEVGVLNAALDACRQRADWVSASRLQRLVAAADSNADADTTRLLALCAAGDAAAAPVAWSFEDPHAAISARTKRKEQLKSDARSPARLREVLSGVIDALEHHARRNDTGEQRSVRDEDDNDAQHILKDVGSLKQWERVFAANAIADIERFLLLCRACALELGHEMWNLYLHALATQQPVAAAADSLETALHTLDDMIRREAVDAMSFNNVLALCSRLGRLDAAERVLALMKQHSAVSTFAYNTVLNCCARQHAVERAEALLAELRARELAPDHVTINSMLKVYASATSTASQRRRPSGAAARAERPSYAQRALKLYQQSVRRDKIAPSATTYFSLLRACAQEADRLTAVASASDDAGEDADEEDEGRVHDQITALIARICTSAAPESLDTAVFNAAIDYHQRCGDTDAAFGVFNMMTARGFAPNDLTLRLLFAACSRSEQADVGLRFLQYLMDDHGYHPTVDVLNGAIELCATAGTQLDALELFQGIASSGVLQPTAATYLELIHAFAKHGDVAGALQYTHALQETFGYASLDAYNRVLQACAVSAAPSAALNVLQHLRQSEGLVPNAVSYDMVLKAFASGPQRARRQAAARESEDDDDDKDYGDDDENDDDEEDKEEGEEGGDGSGVVDASRERSDPTAAASAEDVRRMVAQLLEEMRADGLAPSSITYTRAIAACATRGDTKGVFGFVDDILQRDAGDETAAMALLSDASVVNYLRASSVARDLERAVAMADRLKRQRLAGGRRVSARVALQLLSTYKDLGAWREAVAGLRDLDASYGARPNALVFTVVMAACNVAGEWHVASQIFETMQHAVAYRAVYPTPESYIEAIYAAEQQEEWVRATNLFLDMQNKFAADDIPAAALQRIALGRYNENRRKL